MREGWGSVWWRNFRLLFYDQPVPGHLSTKFQPLQLSMGQPTVASVEWLPFCLQRNLDEVPARILHFLDTLSTK